MPRFDYLELSVKNIAEAKKLYSETFGWEFMDFGPEYASTTSGDTDIGFHQTDEILPPLGVICVDNLDLYYANAVKAGAQIVTEIFEFPGGKRFEFIDQSGNKIGVWEKME